MQGTRKHNFINELIDPAIKAKFKNREKTKFKIFDFFADCEYFEEKFIYDEPLSLPKFSQGDAGQFRTPRNIIDFMVKVIDPQKNEIIIDPACGIAGLLIASYKHIMKANTKKHRAIFLQPANGKNCWTIFEVTIFPRTWCTCLW
jgi:DNA primase